MAQTLAQDIKVYEAIPAAQRTAKQSAALATDLATQRRQTAHAAPSSSGEFTPLGTQAQGTPPGTPIPTAADRTNPAWGIVSGLSPTVDVQAKAVAAGTQVWTAPGVTEPAPGVTPAEAAAGNLAAAGLSPTQPAPYYDPTTKQFFVEPVGNAMGLNPAGTPTQLAAAAEKVSGAPTIAAAEAAYAASLVTASATATPTPAPAPATPTATPTGGGTGQAPPTAATNNAQPDLSGIVGTGGSSGGTSGGSAPSGSVLSSFSATDWAMLGGLAVLAYVAMRKGHAA